MKLFIAALLLSALLLCYFTNEIKASDRTCRGPAGFDNKKGTFGTAVVLQEQIESEILSAVFSQIEEAELKDEEEAIAQFADTQFFKKLKKLGKKIKKGVKKIGKGIKKAAKKVGKGVKKVGKKIGKAAKKVGKAVAKVAKAIGKALKKFFKGFGHLFSKKAKKIIQESKSTFDVTGPTNKVQPNRVSFQAAKAAECVACRVDCMEGFSGRKIFSRCTKHYYYYGCQANKPCIQPGTASDDEIEGMIGICQVRGGCDLAPHWKNAISGVDAQDKQLLKKIVETIRNAGTLKN
ncbi:hypothetical protein ABK040_001764 [Willaertia magna]